MTQANILELAKQGDPRAIAALLTHQLQPQGIAVKAALKDGCLQLMLESDPVSEQQDVLEIVRKGIMTLGAESIQTVKVYGRQTGEKSPIWAQEFDLEPKLEAPSYSSGSDSSYDNDYQNNSPETDPLYIEHEDILDYSEAEEEKGDSGKGNKKANAKGGLQSLTAAPSKVKFLAVGGLATLLIAGGAIYKFTLGSQEAATESSPAPVAVAKPASATKANASKPQASPAATKPQPKATATAAAKSKPKPVAATKPQTSPTAVAKPKPTPVAAANSQADPMQQAVSKAEGAAKLVQSAKSKQEWNAVATQWQEAIALMKAVPQTHPKYKVAQERAGQYQNFLAYAQQNAKR